MASSEETKDTTAEVALGEPLSLKADGIIKNHVMGTMAAATVPVPAFDVAAISVIQMRMIQKLAELHGQQFSDAIAKNVLTSLVSSVLGYSAGIVAVSSVVKVLPGVGTLAGMATLTSVAGATTYAVGQVLNRHFEDGGGLDDLSVDDVANYGRQQFKRGKNIARNMAKSGKEPA